MKNVYGWDQEKSPAMKQVREEKSFITNAELREGAELTLGLIATFLLISALFAIGLLLAG